MLKAIETLAMNLLPIMKEKHAVECPGELTFAKLCASAGMAVTSLPAVDCRYIRGAPQQRWIRAAHKNPE